MLSAGFVEGALKARGWLTAGRVTGVSVAQAFDSGSGAEVARLAVTYEGAPPEAPATVVAKVCGDEAADDGARELRFLRRVAPLLEGEPAPKLYAAAGAMEERRIVLVMEDVETGGWAKTVFPPAETDLERVTDFLAGFHARFWNGAWPEDFERAKAMRSVTRAAQAYPLEAVEQNVRAVEAATGRFLAEHSAELTADERRLLERVVALWPAMMRTRSETTDHLTLVHGDFHLMGNVFQPPPGQTRLKVIDWSEVKPGRGPHDLAYALVSAASPDRAARDRRLLKRYVTALEAHGVRGYGLDAAYLDYRFSLLTNLFQSVFQDSPRWLRVTLDAVRDHDAEAVLD